MKAAAVCLATILALAVQTTMLPFALAGRGHVDLVLVVVIYAALQFGPATGLLTGALAGMAQDALSGGVIGVGGVAKTIVGFLAGAIGSQFIVANAVPRFVVLLFGAALHSACVLGLYAVIDKRGFAAVSWRTAWPQVLMTAGIGIILIQTVQAIPGFLMRRRLRRGSVLARAGTSRGCVCRRQVDADVPAGRDPGGRRRAVRDAGDLLLVRPGAAARQVRGMAASNHSRTLPLRAPRGMLFDRNGRLLVENRDALNISLVRENRRTLDQNIKLLAEVTEVPERAIRDILERNRRVPAYRPVVIIQDASLAQVSAVLARKRELSDVIVEQVPTRRYPEGRSRRAPLRLRRRNHRRAAGAARVHRAHAGRGGRAGRHRADLQQSADGQGRRARSDRQQPRTRNHEARGTAVDRRQAAAVDDRLRPAESGAGRLHRRPGSTGRRSCWTPAPAKSSRWSAGPAFDPNSFSGGIDRNTWAQLTTDKLRPLQNRAIQGRYSPGSTFKIAVAVAALEEGHRHAGVPHVLSGRRHVLRPLLQVPLEGRPRLASTCGTALEKSCNVYFYTLGNMLGIDRMHKWAIGARPRRDERHRPAARDARPDAVDGLEEDHARTEVVSG